MQANKTADNQYLIPLIDGTIENIDITDGILLTTSEFVSQEDIEMTTTHDDLSLFQISFCMRQNQEPAGSIHSLPVSEMTASRNIW